MEVTEFGMVIPVRLEHLSNAEPPIPFVSFFKVYVVAVVVITPTAHLSAYLTLSTTGRLVQPENASLPMVVTESGMVIPVRLEQLPNV